jgi:thioredoxin-like negative regulator of GroEL
MKPELAGALRALTIAATLIVSATPSWSAGAAASAPAASAPTVSAEMAKPLTAAQDLLKTGQGKEALARLKEAEALPNPSPFEIFMIERLRAPAALSAGDKAQAVRSLEWLLGSDQLDPADKMPMTVALTQTAFELRDYSRSARWAQRYIDAGGTDSRVRLLLPQSLYLGGDRSAAAKFLAPLVDADTAAGVRTAEITIRLLASAQSEAPDSKPYVRTLERLAELYPKPEYWSELADRLARQENFAERLRLDLLRFKRSVGVLKEADELFEMAQLANQAGYPAEAARVVEEGFAGKLLGEGKDGASQRQFRDQVNRAAAKDRSSLAESEASARKSGAPDSLLAVGFALATDGDPARGLPLIELAMTAKTPVRRLDEARLHLAQTQWWAGRKDAALATLATVQGGDGSADLARLWRTYLRSPAANVAK